MNPRRLARCLLCLAAVVCLLAGASPVGADSTAHASRTARCADITGVWEAGYFLSDIKVYALQENATVSGVVYVTGWTGNTSTYHFQGNVNGTDIEASHFRGHHFIGQALPDGGVAGVITTAKKGHKIKLEATRVGDLPPEMAGGDF